MLSTHIDPFAAFCRDLQLLDCEVHLYRGPNAFGAILDKNMLPQEMPWWDTENVYFLAGVRPGMAKRAADADVLQRGMFTLDFDIRKVVEERSPITKIKETFTLPHREKPYTMAEYVEERANDIIEALDKDTLFKHFRYAVLSGNGLHVHYFGAPVTLNGDKEAWTAGMKELFAQVNKITSIPCDTGCGNAGRIMRMPGSWNLKDPANRKLVDFLCWQHDEHMRGETCFPMIEVLVLGRDALRKQEEAKAAAQAEFSAEHPDGRGSNVIDLINSIPIEQVIAQLFPGLRVCAHKKDGGLRFADEKGTERGFFKHHQHNILIHEGTSLFPTPEGGNKGYNPLSLVKTVLSLTAAEAIAWFAARSTPVRAERDREQAEWAAGHAAKAVELYDAIKSDSIKSTTPSQLP